MSFLQTMVGKISSTTTRVARLDTKYNALITILGQTNDVHNGDFYMFRRPFYLAKDAVLDILLVFPNQTKEHHMHMAFSGVAGEFNVKLYGGTTVSANGTDRSSWAINHNFRSTNTHTMGIYQAPTITSLGGLGGEGQYGAGKASGGEGESVNEFIMPNNLNALLRITNGSATAQYINVILHWSEKEPIN